MSNQTIKRITCSCGVRISFEGIVPAKHKCFRCGKELKPGIEESAPAMTRNTSPRPMMRRNK